MSKPVSLPASVASHPAAAPPPAVAPFPEPQAKRHQKAWADYLAVPVEQANSIGMKLVLIPPGEFSMGTAADAARKSNAQAGESPSHRVKITRPFLLGAYEVSQAEYQRLMQKNPSHFAPRTVGRESFSGQAVVAIPVESVSWTMATEFCHRLSDLTAEQSAGRKYRLPTEAEWEYACRAGSTTRWYFGNDDTVLADYAWFSQKKPQAVGQKKPNAWGLCDMLGNVSEWCADWFSPEYYKGSPSADPAGPSSGVERVIRGGSWWNAASCRSAARVGAEDDGNETTGFRVLCEIRATPASVRR